MAFYVTDGWFKGGFAALKKQRKAVGLQEKRKV